MKSIYWISTIILVVFLFWSSYSYIFNKQAIEGFEQLGFPNYFRIQLAVLKIIAAVIILFPQISVRIKEWGYIGVGLFLLTAIVAHFVNKDSFVLNLINFGLAGILIVSYSYLHKLN